MMNCNKRNVNIISFCISLIIFSIIIYFLNLIILKTSKESNVLYNNKILSINEISDKNNISNEDISLENIKKWKIIIEKLNLEANIKEGEEENNIKENVGHYKESNYLKGNVSLKAYNTGENKNYFANLKELKIDDEIKYIINEKEYIYKVKENIIIDNEYEYAKKQYNENKLTLITYIKDIDNKKRCVIAEKS